MARKQTLDLILQTFKQLGGNLNEVMGTKTNISFLGKGKSPELMLDMDINTDALGVLPQSAAVDELKSSVGYALSGKLNDIQANKLLENMTKMKNFYMPPPGPANITDLATRTRDLDKEGLMSLRDIESRSYYNKPGFKVPKGMDPEDLREIAPEDLPPPGSRGGPDDIAAPIQDAETTIRNLEAQDPELASQFRNIILSNEGGNPSKRATAREFLVEALKEDDVAKGGNTFSDFVTKEDLRYIPEGGGGVAGDPLILVEKYFGPRIRELVPEGASSEEIVIFTKRVLNNVVDAAGNKPDSPRFDRFTARFIDEVQDFAKGGLAKILEV